MAKIIHNGVEYGGSGYSKNEIDRKLGLKLNKSSIDTEISEDSSNPVQNRVIANALNDKISQVNVMPTPNENELGKIVQYVGATNANYINGYFYKCVSDGGVTPAYSWEKIRVSDGGDTIQVETLPTASADELGNIYEFVGTTTANYINGRFYRCVSDGASTPTYSWEEVDFGDGTPHWSGTRAEYEAIKDTLEVGTIICITDDYDEGLEVVDVVEEDNMNPVTSNAVAETLGNGKKIKIATPTLATGVTGTVQYHWQRNECTVLFQGIIVPAGFIFNSNFITNLPQAATDAIVQYGTLYALGWDGSTWTGQRVALTNIPAGDTALKADGNIGAAATSIQVYGSFTYRTKDWYEGN